MLSVIASLSVASPLAADEPIIVTRDSQSLPSGCSTRGVVMLVDGFFRAFNAGQWEQVDGAFAVSGPTPPNFTLLSWQQDVVRERERVTPFLAALRDRGEQLRLVSLLATRESNTVPTSVAVTYAFERPGGFGWGKGLIDCGSQRIWQWAMSPRGADLAVPCPRTAGWSPTGPILACTAGPNASTFSSDFRVTGGSSKLPQPCAPPAAKRRLGAVLSGFNRGQGAQMASQFAPRGSFQPYTIAQPLGGRTRVAVFANLRYKTGVGWTATALNAPTTTAFERLRGSRTRGAVYRLGLRLSSPGKPPVAAPASVAIDCLSGLVYRWTGPRIAIP